LLAAVLVVARSAPWPADWTTRWRLAAILAGFASVSTLVLLMEGQRSAVDALGLALAYHEWRAGRLARGGALLGLTIGIVKPQLAIGFAGFMLGWRDRRLLAGAVTGAIASVAVNGALAGIGGVTSWVSIVEATPPNSAIFVSVSGIVRMLVGDGALAHIALVGGIAAAFAAAAVVVGVVRRKRCSLEVGCAAAALLTLLAVPEAFMYDLALLSSVLVWLIATALAGDAAVPSRIEPRLVAVLAGWAALSVAMLVYVASGSHTGGGIDAGAVVPPVLIACTAVTLVAVFHPNPATLAATS
jgi:hypothetical protein